MSKIYVGAEVIGVKFNTIDNVYYNSNMDNYIGKKGVITSISNKFYMVQFYEKVPHIDNLWAYPITCIEKALQKEGIPENWICYSENQYENKVLYGWLTKQNGIEYYAKHNGHDFITHDLQYCDAGQSRRKFRPDGYIPISFEDFQKYVLNKETIVENPKPAESEEITIQSLSINKSTLTDIKVSTSLPEIKVSLKNAKKTVKGIKIETAPFIHCNF